MPVGSVIYGFCLDLWPPYLFLLGTSFLILAVTLFFLKVASPEAFSPALPRSEAAGSAGLQA